ncbi:dihydrofolate reductase family protein [Micromonospora sp. RHAY321]|uniref:dihydrofolate reductase family protein n=1 Tax=Micromonospora sp. RHAY321 TaxID=2944807 RepID=UPI0027E34DA5|nr:dihydrofolate reductase family protein [Micromonospora sp. RHAY321]
MGRLVATTFMSLDGVIKNPEEWQGPFFGEDAGRFAEERLFASDALLLGRGIYEVYAATWPTMDDDGGFVEKINKMPKYVVSTTLDKAEWENTTIIRGDVADQVAKLKQEFEQDILVYGVGQLAHELLAHGLVDELEVWVHPILVGRTGGEALIGREGSRHEFELVGTETTELGVIICRYRPAVGKD